MDSHDSEQIDARLRAAFTEKLPDASAVQKNVRKRIAAERSRDWAIVGVAAAAALLMVGYGMLTHARGTDAFAELARDHRNEVIEQHPRRWRSEPAELETLIDRYSIKPSMLAGLAPAGYHLEHAKTCGVAGKPMLHLVYTNGSRRFSIYLRRRSGVDLRYGSTTVDSEQVDTFQQDGFEAAVVTAGSRDECAQWARHAASVL